MTGVAAEPGATAEPDTPIGPEYDVDDEPSMAARWPRLFDRSRRG